MLQQEQVVASGGIANGTQTFYQVFDENGDNADTSNADGNPRPGSAPAIDMSSLNFDDNGVLIIDVDANDAVTDVLTLRDNDDQNCQLQLEAGLMVELR